MASARSACSLRSSPGCPLDRARRQNILALMSNIAPPTDLAKRPPRSTRSRLGGYVLLPRIIDKCRAVIA